MNPSGEYNRDQRYIPTRITEDGRDGYPVEPGRYRLIVSRACPWANRAIIVRRLYRRPLDALLATWGLGIVIGQIVTLLFGREVQFALKLIF